MRRFRTQAGIASGTHSRRRKSRSLALFGYVLLALVCLLAAATTFLLIATPVDFVREQLVQQVKARTGRDLLIAGPTSISLLPRVSVSLGNVALSGPPGMGAGAVLTAQAFAIDLPLTALLSREFAVQRLVLSRPIIELRIDASGRRNWDFTAAHAASTTADATDPPDVSKSGETARFIRAGVGLNATAGFDRLKLENVRITDGTLRFSDERTDIAREFTSIDIDLSLADLGGPLSGKGNVAWQGEKIAFDGKLSPARALLEEQRARAALSVTGRPGQASYDGTIQLVGGLALAGKATLKIPSLRSAGAWLGRHLSDEPGTLDFKGAISLEKGRLSLPDMSAEVAGNVLSGSVEVETDRPRPYITGNLRASELDLGRFLMGRKLHDAAAPDDKADPGRKSIGPGESAREAPQRQKPGANDLAQRVKSPGWSEVPIDLAPLQFADADVGLVVDRILYKNIKTGQSQLSLSLHDRVAKLTFQELLLYGGRGRGVLTLDGSGAEPATSTDVTLDNVLCGPLLADGLGFDGLVGRGKIVLAVRGHGPSERKIIETLSGRTELAIANGDLSGFDAAKLVRAIEQARFGDLEVAPSDRTQFSELAGTFLIANGVAKTDDLRLVSSHVRVTGSGASNLPDRHADYLMRLKIAEIGANPDAVIKISNLEVPIRVTGPWHKLAFKPDLKDFNPEQVGDAIKQIGKNLNKPEIKEAVKGLLSGDGQQRVKPRELLEKLLKKE